MAPLVSRASPPISTTTLIIIIVTATIGVAIILAVTLVSLRIRRRRHVAARSFKDACLRDPTLTWEEYGKRRKLTISRLLVEEELLRSNIIRKSQQSRTSENPSPDPLVSKPSRSRSKTWHGRTAQSDDVDLEEGKSLLKGTLGAWGSAEANVEYTWRLLHGKKYPSPLPSTEAMLDEFDGGMPERPPTVRLKTPPLLSHPLFRCSSAAGGRAPKHLSLPAELMRVKSDPGFGLTT